MSEKAFYSIKEVADMLGVQYQTVYNLVQSGELPCLKVGKLHRIQKDKFWEWVEQHSTKNKPNKGEEKAV